MSKIEETLSFVTVENSDGSRDASADGCEFTGILLHGFGASAQDLVPLGPALGTASQWIVPHAPVPITVAGMSYGRAWFPRESDALEQAVFGSYFQDLRRIEPPGLQIAAGAVRRLIDTQELSWDHLIIGGFSQGAMVAAEILRQGAVNDERPLPAAVALFSGALVAARWWDGVHTSRARTVPVFQSHGKTDRILPVANGWALADRLTAVGFPVERHEFPGAHEIPPGVQTAAAAFLQRRFRSV